MKISFPLTFSIAHAMISILEKFPYNSARSAYGKPRARLVRRPVNVVSQTTSASNQMQTAVFNALNSIINPFASSKVPMEVSLKFEFAGGGPSRPGNTGGNLVQYENSDDWYSNTITVNCKILQFSNHEGINILLECFPGKVKSPFSDMCVKVIYKPNTKIAYLALVTGSSEACPPAKMSLKVIEERIKTLGATEIEVNDASKFQLFRNKKPDVYANPKIRTLLWFALFSDAPMPASYYSGLGYDISCKGGRKLPLYYAQWSKVIRETHKDIQSITVHEVLAHFESVQLGDNNAVQMVLEPLKSKAPQLLHEYCKSEFKRLSSTDDRASQIKLVALVELLERSQLFKALSETCYMRKVLH